MGTTKESFVALTQRINSRTGGITPQTFTSALANSQGSAAWLFMRSKAMHEQVPELLDIFRDVLLNAQLDNRQRFLQMVLEEKAQAEQSLIPGGHQFVALRLRSHFGEAFRAAENMSGISYLFFLRELAEKVKQNWSRVKEHLERMRNLLLNRRGMIFNLTMDNKTWPKLEPELEGLLQSLPEAPAAEVPWSSGDAPLSEGLTIPAQVNYVGKGANLYTLGYRFHGSAAVIARYLRNTWLWEQVRVQGGAYGAFCILDRISGILTFVSYRDPNLLNTLDVFDRAAEFLRGADLSREELTKSIIGAIGDLDAHMLPDAKGYVSMLRYLNGDSEEARQRMRDEILATEAGDFKDLAGVLERVKQEGIVKVLGPANAIQATDRERPGWLKMVRVL
jgi:Zn-dependent M16 (insulinase) family peptidase